MDLKDKLSIGISNLFKLKGECYLNLVDDLDISEMSLKQINYLKQLNKTCGTTTSQLAEALDLSKPTVTEMVKKFIKLEFVYKQSCPADGRVYYLKLTEKGKKIADLDILTHEVLASKLLNRLSEDDINGLIEILMKID
jgi:DNA-binding MarR family transcriptional regulator